MQPDTGKLELKTLNSLDELRSSAERWDDLWFRSEVRIPRSRAHLLALWVETFSSGDSFQALVVEENGRLLAALPLVSRTYRRLFKVGSLATSLVAIGGDLLLDPECSSETVLTLLLSALIDLPFVFLSFDAVAFNEPRWKSFLETMEGLGMAMTVSEQFRVGQVVTEGEWETYEEKLSKNHRRNRRKQARMLEEAGGARLGVFRDIAQDEVVPLLRRGFEVEDRSWKGAAGTSVLKSQGMFEYFSTEAIYLAKQGQLELAFLEHGEGPIAFLYGWNSKGVHFTPKVGYDATYEKFGPGQQLMMHFLHELHTEPPPQYVDFQGPLVPWTESWITVSYPVGRIVATTNHHLSRSLFNLNYELKSRWKRFRKGGG